jgi:PAS domain S-box-containing protein
VTPITDPPAFVRTPEHLTDFVDTAAVGLHWVGPDGTILWANPADYEFLGYTAEEYIGHNIAEFHADADVIADILGRLAAGERIVNYEARLRGKDGGIRHVQITSSVLFEDGPDGRRFVHTRCYTQDISDRKRMEQARDRFVAILGHDLRNPLSAIVVAAQFLLKADDLPERHQKTVKRISQSSARISRMVEDLIDFARRLGGPMPIKRQPVDFGDVCRRIVEETQTAFPGIEIETRLSGDLSGEWDPERVAQAICNLIGNAVRHGQPPFLVRVADEGPAVRLDVVNHGEPIPPARLPDIFEPFSQTTSTDGLGLGLFIVRDIVSAHGGCVDVRSSASEGTTFSATWPRGVCPE